jgi:hypothetical protein
MENKLIKVKLNFEIQLTENDVTQPEDFNKLIVFFNNLKTIHSGVIKECCLEYSKSYPNQKLKDEHKLKFEMIEKNNFLHFSLFFQINHEEVASYLTLIKYFFAICERYGKDTKHLKSTINSIQDAYEDIKKIFNKVQTSDSKKKNENSLLKSYNNLMSNKNFKKVYNSFCRNGIFIKKLTSKIEGAIKEIDFLD